MTAPLAAERLSPPGRTERPRHAIAGVGPGWLWALVIWIVTDRLVHVPTGPWLAGEAVLTFGMFLRPPHVRYAPVPVAPPARGVWSVLNSPGSAVPSHGVRAYGQTYAVDALRRDPDAAFGWSHGFRRPEQFDAFGEPVHAVADGTVVRAVDRRRDHLSRSSWPALVYLLTVETVRELGGPGAVVGNHVVIDHGNGVFSLMAHLRRWSVRVRPGQTETTVEP